MNVWNSFKSCCMKQRKTFEFITMILAAAHEVFHWRSLTWCVYMNTFPGGGDIWSPGMDLWWSIWTAFQPREGGIWTKIFQKFKCPGSCPGGMFKLRFDWYIMWCSVYLVASLLVKLVIVLTNAAPAFFVKCLFFSPFFWLFNRFGYLNQSGKFHLKIATFHYTQCIH